MDLNINWPVNKMQHSFSFILCAHIQRDSLDILQSAICCIYFNEMVTMVEVTTKALEFLTQVKWSVGR